MSGAKDALNKLTKPELVRYGKSWALIKTRIKISDSKPRVIQAILRESRPKIIRRMRPFKLGPRRTVVEIRRDVAEIVARRKK
jgi:hypothetical protein